jgi:hypothetical protein
MVNDFLDAKLKAIKEKIIKLISEMHTVQT